MISDSIILRGVSGLVEGEVFTVDVGETIIIGRSSGCDVSLKKCERFLMLPEEERLSEKHFQTVSRKHARVSFHNATTVEIEDLSSNGTFLDGEQIQKVVVSDLQTTRHELLLGTKEMFVLEWGGATDAPTLDDEDDVDGIEELDDEEDGIEELDDGDVGVVWEDDDDEDIPMADSAEGDDFDFDVDADLKHAEE